MSEGSPLGENDGLPSISRARRRVALAAVIVIAVLIAALTSRRVPRPAPFSAPAEAFSAERARVILDRMVGDGVPHPTGSPANEVVRDRVIAELTAVGLEPKVELGFACSANASCADVQNVVARIPGAKPGPAVVLNAHFDSVPAGPGGGDDAAAVAALVEVARALRAGPPPPREIVLLVDDGEEAGLLGAEAFVRRHDPKSFHSIIVFESRGSSGRALMFETSRLNRAVVDAYARAVSSPSTSSLSFSVYELLPNDTNFTVFKREGMRGMTVAFIGDAAQYHTPLNRAENVPSGTIQHVGDTALGLARTIGGERLEATTNASYFDLFGLIVVRWPEPWNPWLAIAGAALVFARMIVGFRRGESSVRGSVTALGWAIAALAAAAIAARGLLAIAEIRMREVAWPANHAWLEGGAWALAIAAVAYSAHFARRRVSPADAWNACGLLWSVVAIALAFVLPGGAYCFFVPLLSGAIVSHAGRARGLRAAPLVLLAVGGALVFNVAIDLVLAMGAAVVAVPAVIIALLWLAVAPALIESGLTARAGALALVLAAGALVGLLATPVWTTTSPRPINFIQVDAGEGGDARLVVADFGAGDPPPPIGTATTWTLETVPELSVGLRVGTRQLWSAVIPRSGEPLPSVSLVSWAPQASKRIRATVRLQSNRGARVVRLRADPLLEPSILRVGRHEFGKPATTGIVTVHSVDAGGVEVELEFTPRPGATLTIQDETPDLPPPARDIAAMRTAAMSPIQRGDRLIASRTVPLTPALR